MGIRKFLRNHRDLIYATVLICLVGLIISSPWLANGEEQNGLPFAYGLRGEIPAQDDVVIVDINDISNAKGLPDKLDIRGFRCDLALENRVRSFAGPMPRCLYAFLIDKIAAGRPDAIAVDVSFEKDGNAKEDTLLGAAIGEAANVVLLRRIRSEIDPSTNLLIERLENINPLIGDNAFAWAPFPLPKRPALVNQFWSTVDAFGGIATLPTMALFAPYREIFDAARGEQPMEEFVRDLLDGSNFGDKSQLPLGSDAWDLVKRLQQTPSHTINFFGRPGTISIVDAYDILQTETSPDLSNKTVFIGQVHLNTYQQSDNFPTVYSQPNGIDLAGVEIAATAFLNLQNDTTLKRPAPWQSTLLVVVAGLMLALLVARYKPAISFAIVPTLLLAYTIVMVFVFSEQNLWLPSMGIYAMAVAAIPVGTYFQIDRFYALLDLWVPQGLRRNMWSSDDVTGAPVEITGLCLKCDIADYTAASAETSGLNLILGVDAYMTNASDLVTASAGQIFVPGDDSFIAVWAFDRADDDAWRRVLPVVFDLSNNALEVDGENGKAIRHNRIGLAHGSFSVGGMGGRGNRAMNAQGLTVNLASRLEALNKQIGTRILAPAELEAHLPHVIVKDQGAFELRGIGADIKVIELQRLR